MLRNEGTTPILRSTQKNGPTTVASDIDNAPSPLLSPLVLERAPRTSRAHAALIDADNDREAVAVWLAEYRDRPNTFEAYRKEAERLLLWLRVERKGASLARLSREDWLAYERFLRAPPTHWCGPSFPRADPRWRPLKGPLGERSVRYAMGVAYNLMHYLVASGYLTANPLALRRRGRQATLNRVERYLPASCLRAIGQALDALPGDGEEARRARERARFVLIWAELTGGRASELCAARMADVVRDERSAATDRAHTGAADAPVRWWWQIPAGKGHKAREVPLHTEAMQALAAYRQSLGLPALPHPGETDRALIWGLRGPERHRGVNRSTLFRLTKKVFLAAAEHAAATDAGTAEALRAASTHWLRHSTATNALDAGVELRAVKALMGHSSLDTTLKYVHDDRAALHRKTQRAGAWSKPSDP